MAEVNQKINLSLSGMHCASCARLIEMSLKKVAGVSQSNVNFAAEKAMVIFDPRVTNPPALIEAVKKAGYKAEEIDSKDTEFEARKRQKEIKSYFNKFILSAIFSLPMAYFMFLDFFSWWPGGSSLLPFVGIVSLFLATPVQFVVGAGF